MFVEQKKEKVGDDCFGLWTSTCFHFIQENDFLGAIDFCENAAKQLVAFGMEDELTIFYSSLEVILKERSHQVQLCFETASNCNPQQAVWLFEKLIDTTGLRRKVEMMKTKHKPGN